MVKACSRMLFLTAGTSSPGSRSSADRNTVK
ncbi:hypothetical protein FOXYSP1_02050 [Fusarium oxysporum f. sp. phaseoli]